MSVILQCLKKEVVKFAIRRSLVKMALGDSIEEREICGRVFFGGSLPANTVSAVCGSLRAWSYNNSTRYGGELKAARSATLTDGAALTWRVWRPRSANVPTINRWH